MILGMVCHQVDPNHLQPAEIEEMVCRPRGLDRNDINAGWWKPHYRGWPMIWGKYWKKTWFQRALDRSWCSLTVFFYLKILQDTVNVSWKNPAGMLSLHRQAVVCKLGLNVRSDLRIFCRVFLAQITNKLIKALINLINWQDESDFCSKKVGFIHSSYWWGESPGCSPHGGFLVIRCCLPWLLGFFVRKWKWDVSTRVRIWVGMLLPYGVP